MIQPYFIYEVTPRCTNDCKYCYNVWQNNSSYPNGELSLTETKKLFDKLLKETNTEGITLTGGEPLLHKDIFAIVSFLNDKNIKIGLATNGVLLNEENTKSLVDRGVSYFEVSLLSINQKTYSYLCQNKELEKVKKAILNIKNLGARLTVSCVITKYNLDDIEEAIDLSFAFLADTIALNRFVPGGSGLNYLSELEINEEELKDVLLIADNKANEYNLPINITIPIEHCIINQDNYPNLNFGSCVCGQKKWVIDPVGNLRTCEQNPSILGSLFDNSFSRLSQLEDVKLFQDNNLKVECDTCKKFSNCGGGCRFLK